MTKKLLEIREELADEIWYGLPSDERRKKMSPRELAKLLSESNRDTPKYILLEHELNRRIAEIQARPARWSVWSGLVGIILGWVLGQWQPFQ